MDIDNSRAGAFRTCPWGYFEQYVRNVEPVPAKGEGYNSLDFGGRVHELLHEHYANKPIYPQCENDVLEMEAEALMQAYKAKYPNEQFEVVDVERPFKVALPDYCPQCYGQRFIDPAEHHPAHRDYLFCETCDGPPIKKGRHNLIGKIDLTFRDGGILNIMDHKTEKRSAKSNLPQKWGSKDQASLYLWAAPKIYGERIGNFFVNVLARQSDKGLVGPSFPERQRLERAERDLEITIRDIVIIADEIERYTRIFGNNEWPANRENCYGWGYCDFYQLHRYGEDVSEILKYRFQNKKEYLDVSELKVIQ